MTNLKRIDCPCGKSFTKSGYGKHKCDQKIQTFECQFCKKNFQKEKTLLSHLCEQKRRHLQKDDKAVRLGYMAYELFYKKSMNKSTNYESFSKSMLYGAFVRFGKYIMDLNAVNPLAFVDFLIRIEAPIDRWTNDSLYSTFIKELNKTEPPIDAIERNFLLMQQWSISSGEEWYDFFRKVEPPQATLWILNGRLSPWLMFTASSAHEMFSRFTQEQKMMIEKSIDVEFWQTKMERHKKEVEIIKQMLAEHEI